jgi:hypothetical protein
MADESAQPFTHNWAYLKVELRWLDRVLLTAVSRQRSDEKAIGRVAQTEKDHVTSHWWKGIVTLPRSHPREEGPPPKGTTTTQASYSQQLAARVAASEARGVVLALPALQAAYDLTLFEKNLLLMGLAPEINRRYGRLYDYLQDHAGELEDLPTVDLCLRLLCRNDRAWQLARSRLVAADSLMEKGLVEWIGDEGTLLSQQVRLSDAVANYLLAASPTPQVPDFGSDHAGTFVPAPRADAPWSSTPGEEDTLAHPPEADEEGQRIADGTDGEEGPQLVATPHIPCGNWETLILPRSLKSQLRSLARQGQQRQPSPTALGLVVLWAGPAGTGKTTAATAIATDMAAALAVLNLHRVLPQEEATLLDSSVADGRPLLVQGGDRWFGRHATATAAQLHSWWQQRQRTSGLTVVTVTHIQAIRPRWRQRFDAILMFPRPDCRARQKLWQQVWPASIIPKDIDWRWVARQLPLTGGEIVAIAQTAHLELQARQRRTLTLKALRDAIALHHPHLKDALQSPP